MFAQVRKKDSFCTVCDSVTAYSEVKDPTLKSIMGMDSAFVRCRSSRYLETGMVVMIKHFSKWIELVWILKKTSHHSAAAFQNILCSYGAPVKVLMDQGEEFAELLTKLLIDHVLLPATTRN
jgi:hypothetical protein